MDDDLPSARIAAELRSRIVDGDLAPGDRLPSTRALATEHRVAPSTAARALTLLRDHGWTRTVSRVGSVVAEPTSPTAPHRMGPDATTEDVVAVAIALADAEGLAVLSMRRVAATLGVPTMSLYRLVRGKDDLLVRMIDAVFAAAALPSAPGPWRARLEALARRQWRIHGRHPWLARALSLSRPQASPALLRLADAELAALEEIVDDPVTRFDLHVVLTSFVRGMAVDLAAELDAAADTGLDADTWADRDPALREALRRHGGPALRRVGDYPYDLQRIFDTGLTTLLDGFERIGR
ncbi:TetR family transcriptional regulator [Actinomycetospora succinea]|uniref:TetR family transcriptional regulator n=1 Tax=Actinomycetospora succinea TaxID=663603 RepID=A0A4R6VJZ5_9PSEU|nr:GntR family transcriptional regulator [Actinomycetospora succinea]TDQ63166.1 TetR family transcriptional regulator [Actinomycetospora succinea]